MYLFKAILISCSMLLTGASFADLDKAIKLTEQGKIKEGRLELEKISNHAKNGNPKAQYEFGVMWIMNYWTSKDDIKAIEWWLRSAEQNYPDAQFILGFAYTVGRGVDIDFNKAREWTQKAINNKDSGREIISAAMNALDYIDEQELRSEMIKRELEPKEIPKTIKYIRFEQSIG